MSLLRTKNKLSGNLRLEVLVFVESDIAGSSLAIEYAEWDLTAVLGSHVQLRHGVYTFQNLSSDDCFQVQARTEKHDL